MANDDFHTSAMVTAVRDMAQRLEQYQQHADAEREKLRLDVQSTIEAMRKDVHVAIASLQIRAMQHEDTHTAERKERAVDAVDRLNRQLILNLWLGAVTVLAVINLLLIGYIVVQVAKVLYGR